MASGGSERDTKYALSKLLQMGTVAEYQSEFEILINRVTGISENVLESFYISGLKPALQCALLRSNYTIIGEAFSLARATKARFTDLQLWELLRSNPTTLGEAFSLDERTTTTINLNDLNIAVPDQVLEESTLHTSDKVEAVSTSMGATYEEHGCQDGLRPVTTRSASGKKGIGCGSGKRDCGRIKSGEVLGIKKSASGSGISESDISGLVSQLKEAEDEQHRAMEDAAALRAELNSLQQQAINGDIGAIISKGGLPDHMQASEKELAVLKSPLEQESLFKRQEGIL
ncbi:hypothetical protein Tco_0853936 [Tanacetum coccineum]